MAASRGRAASVFIAEVEPFEDGLAVAREPGRRGDLGEAPNRFQVLGVAAVRHTHGASERAFVADHEVSHEGGVGSGDHEAIRTGLRLAELGCGGTPAVFLAERCVKYTAADFSSTGLSEAAVALKRTNVPFEIIETDITDLPFEDGAFDVVYSAHAIYHIDTVDGQAAAFREAMRVVRPGGRAIFVLANPFPLLFPYRLIRRVLAMTPGFNTGTESPAREAAAPLFADALGMDKGTVREVGRCKDHRTCGAKCSVRPPRV